MSALFYEAQIIASQKQKHIMRIDMKLHTKSLLATAIAMAFALSTASADKRAPHATIITPGGPVIKTDPGDVVIIDKGGTVIINDPAPEPTPEPTPIPRA